MMFVDSNQDHPVNPSHPFITRVINKKQSIKPLKLKELNYAANENELKLLKSRGET